MDLDHPEYIKLRLEDTGSKLCFREPQPTNNAKCNATPDVFYGRSCLRAGIEGIDLRIKGDGFITFSSGKAHFIRNKQKITKQLAVASM